MTTEKASVVIREAAESDFDLISDLMQEALEPYYGGDHRAHAKRIFEAHISGGMDLVGFFSFEQRMFVVEYDGVVAGMLHLVGKRQQTYKISPLILAPNFRGRLGIGSLLIEKAEQYARANGARQLYCTVADQNVGAMQFFLRKGFVRAGSSDSHYKVGVVETMLYKQLHSEDEVLLRDKAQISVMSLEEKHKAQVEKLLLEVLPESFDGIDEAWVRALYDGYGRRHVGDINLKYKLIYVALNQHGEVLGIAGMTPKKGNPIKVMPFIAKEPAAFEALLADLPHQLVEYGRKLYIHINPTPEEVAALQKFGWHLDAAMPSAYRANVVTYQWSLEIGASTMRTMRVKPRFIKLIQSGLKTLEVRVGYDNINRIQAGERIRFVSHENMIDVRVRSVRRYTSIEALLEQEPFEKIAPDLPSKEAVVDLLRHIYPPDKERLGMVVLEILPST
jgi:ASC-1-like (ASCH) protein/ribosomal protein S18 acetylase RimI-like enzyme